METIQEQTVQEILEIGKKRLQVRREKEEQAVIEQLARNRIAWRNRLNRVREQLPEALREFVTVDLDVVDQPVSYLLQQHIWLTIPGCTPISFLFYHATWDIKGYIPRVAYAVGETDDGEPFVYLTRDEETIDIYIAIATAHENHPRYEELQTEVARRKEGVSRIAIYPESDSVLEEVF